MSQKNVKTVIDILPYKRALDKSQHLTFEIVKCFTLFYLKPLRKKGTWKHTNLTWYKDSMFEVERFHISLTWYHK